MFGESQVARGAGSEQRKEEGVQVPHGAPVTSPQQDETNKDSNMSGQDLTCLKEIHDSMHILCIFYRFWGYFGVTPCRRYIGAFFFPCHVAFHEPLLAVSTSY